jgi:hypothetical protein
MRQLTDLGQHLALALDAFADGQVAIAQRMAPARLGKALEQGFGLGVEKQHAHIDAARFEVGYLPRELVERITAARIDADGDLGVAGVAHQIDHFRQQLRGQVIGGVVSAVFECLERYALARAGKSRDDDELH